MKRLRSLLPFRDDASGQALVLTGSGRSGTTWLAELLAGSLGARLVFEPFRPGVVGELSGINNRQYMRPDAEQPRIHEGVERILRGSLRSRWTDRYNDRFFYHLRIVKAIRANLMVGWMLEQFPEIRLVHVVRNPLATMSSQDRGGWKIGLEKFTSQPELVADYLAPFIPLIEQADAPDRISALHWAIENHVPVRQFESGRWPRDRFRIFSYEDLLGDRDTMAAFLGFAGVTTGSIDWEMVERPSRVSRGKTEFGSGKPKMDYSIDTSTYVEKVTAAFGLERWAGMA